MFSQAHLRNRGKPALVRGKKGSFIVVVVVVVVVAVVDDDDDDVAAAAAAAAVRVCLLVSVFENKRVNRRAGVT